MEDAPKFVDVPVKAARVDLLKWAPYLGAGLIGLAIGMKLAQHLFIPPKLPPAPRPCSECAQRRAAEAEAKVQAERRAADLLTPADQDGAESLVERQLHVENPKTFSPAAPPTP